MHSIERLMQVVQLLMISNLEEHVIQGNGIEIHHVTKGKARSRDVSWLPRELYSWRHQQTP